MTITQRALLAKYLRGAAQLHEKARTYVQVDPAFLRAIRDEGVQLDPPATRTLGELTPKQAIHYADQLDRIEREKGAA